MTTQTQLSPSTSAAPVPTLIHHPSHLPSLPLHKPQLLNSIASGAHYGGQLPARSNSERAALSPKRTRSRTRSVESTDPFMENEFKDVMDDLQELFCGRPTMEIIRRRWAEDAVLESPLVRCSGFKQVSHQWFSLAKMVSESERVSARILSATHSPNRLIFNQKQLYTLRLFSIHRTVDSIVLVELDDNFKITRLVDQWDGELPSTGWAATFLKKANARMTPLFIRLPKDRLS